MANCHTCHEPAKYIAPRYHDDCPDCEGHDGGWQLQCGHNIAEVEVMSGALVPYGGRSRTLTLLDAVLQTKLEKTVDLK